MDKNLKGKNIVENLRKIKNSIYWLINDKLIFTKFKSSMLQLISEASCILNFNKISMKSLIVIFF
jgi:hypothetical protein